MGCVCGGVGGVTDKALNLPCLQALVLRLGSPSACSLSGQRGQTTLRLPWQTYSSTKQGSPLHCLPLPQWCTVLRGTVLALGKCECHVLAGHPIGLVYHHVVHLLHISYH